MLGRESTDNVALVCGSHSCLCCWQKCIDVIPCISVCTRRPEEPAKASEESPTAEETAEAAPKEEVTPNENGTEEKAEAMEM